MKKFIIAMVLLTCCLGKAAGNPPDAVEALPAKAPANAEARAVVAGEAQPRHSRKVALIQFDAIPEQPERNLGEMERLLRQAVAQGARIVMFHEGAVCDYTPRLDVFAQRVPDGPACQRMGALARQLDCFVSFGLSERDGPNDHERFYITQVFFGPQGLVYRYRKTWLWRDDVEKDKWYRNELARYDPGTGPESFVIDGIVATCFICADGSAPRCLQRAKALRPQLVFYPNNHMGGMGSFRMYSNIAREIGAPMLVTNRVGDSWQGMCRASLGGTAMFDAEGNVVTKANVEGREEILMVDVSL